MLKREVSSTNRDYRCGVSTLVSIKALMKINFTLHSLYRIERLSRGKYKCKFVQTDSQRERSVSVKNRKNNVCYYRAHAHTYTTTEQWRFATR